MLRKALLLLGGFIALGFGAIGIFLPILPTTPFVICAGICFSMVSPNLYNWLLSTKYFGEYLRNYKYKTGISKEARRNGLLFLWGTLLLSALIFRGVLIWSILFVVGVCVSIHILTIRRVPAKKILQQFEKS
ncbi:MAG: YbaN family protein [Christensenellaceae bacterium]|jgi:uncharacterized membrane protein YbaN (DUF454 family)